MQIEKRERLERLVVEGGDEQALEELMREAERGTWLRRYPTEYFEGWDWVFPTMREGKRVAEMICKVIEAVGYDLQVFIGHTNSRYSMYMCGMHVGSLYVNKEVCGEAKVQLTMWEPSESNMLMLELDMQDSGELKD